MLLVPLKHTEHEARRPSIDSAQALCGKTSSARVREQVWYQRAAGEPESRGDSSVARSERLASFKIFQHTEKSAQPLLLTSIPLHLRKGVTREKDRG